jgi:ABC-type transport system substrate-binding protein
VFPAAESGFDPCTGHDYYSGSVIESIFDRLVTYDYLARPAKLVPLAAESLPEVTNDGKTYTFRIRRGIHFTPDPAFKGRKRELTAADFAYSIKRLMDPRLRSVWKFLVDGKIVGLDEVAKRAASSGKFDYDAPVAGFEFPDRYTLRIRLTATDYNFAHVLAMATVGAVAREVVEHYGDDIAAHPVGTGPYKLARWVRSSKIFLDANPDYRGFVWDFKGSDPEDAAIMEGMQGKRMPQIGRIEISIMEEDQSRWLAFQQDQLDVMNMEGPLAPRALDGGKLKPELAARGIRLSRIVDPEILYTYFNLQDPVVGGMSREKIALRRAMAMAFNAEEDAQVILNGQALALQYFIPQGVVGHDPSYRSSNAYDPALANRLLDRFGYRRDADGWRRQPSGEPLLIRYATRPDTLGRQREELWQRSLKAIGIRMEAQRMPFAELLKDEKQCKLMMRTAAWVADYPDGDNFVQLLYGPNTGQSNNGCVRLPEFDRIYEQARMLPDSPERNRLYRQLARVMEVNGLWVLDIGRYHNMLTQPRVSGFKKHPILHVEWMYFDIEARN